MTFVGFSWYSSEVSKNVPRQALRFREILSFVPTFGMGIMSAAVINSTLAIAHEELAPRLLCRTLLALMISPLCLEVDELCIRAQTSILFSINSPVVAFVQSLSP